jgi:hypothetical protein
MASFGQTAYGTLEPNNSTQEEQISFTGITQNANGTATLTGVKHVLFISPFTESSGLTKTHPGGVKFIITNSSGFYNQFVTKANTQTITGLLTLTKNPTIPGGGASLEVANNDDIANAITGVSGKATNLVYGTAKLSVAAASATVPIAVGDNDTRMPASAAQVSYIPTSDEKAALVGTGTPNSSNKYVTNDDTSATVSANKVVRGNASGKINSTWIAGLTNYQVFITTGSWTAPAASIASPNSIVFVQVWGGGGAGGGSTSGQSGTGGGGGGYNQAYFRLSDLGTSETVTIGAGGTGVSQAAGNVGGNTTFGSKLTSYGGGGGSHNNGGGGGGGNTGVGTVGGATGGAGGDILGGAASTASNFGGGGGGSSAVGGASVYGGGGGGGNSAGGLSIYAGGGGGSVDSGDGTPKAGGLGVVYGGNGGAGGQNAVGVAGTAPAGGGGGSWSNSAAYAGGAGARGECRVWVISGI